VKRSHNGRPAADEISRWGRHSKQSKVTDMKSFLEILEWVSDGNHGALHFKFCSFVKS